MTRPYARSRKGQRAVQYVPHGHWNTTTLVAAITVEGPIAPMVLNGPMDREAFEAYVEQCLVHHLPPNAIVVMDNLSSHKSGFITKAIEQAGAQLRYLPPYSPDYNPIEPMWSKVKNDIKTHEPREKEKLDSAIAQALEKVTPEDARGFFKHCFVRM